MSQDDRIAKLEADVQRLEWALRVLAKVTKPEDPNLQCFDEYYDSTRLDNISARVRAVVDGKPDRDDHDVEPTRG
jgi:hypothetical protein